MKHESEAARVAVLDACRDLRLAKAHQPDADVELCVAQATRDPARIAAATDAVNTLAQRVRDAAAELRAANRAYEEALPPEYKAGVAATL